MALMLPPAPLRCTEYGYRVEPLGGDAAPPR